MDIRVNIVRNLTSKRWLTAGEIAQYLGLPVHEVVELLANMLQGNQIHQRLGGDSSGEPIHLYCPYWLVPCDRLGP